MNQPHSWMALFVVMVLAGCSTADTAGTPTGDTRSDALDAAEELSTLPDSQGKDLHPADVSPDTHPLDAGDIHPDVPSDVSGEQTGPSHRCDEDLDCDDGLTCTADRCVAAESGLMHCAWSLDAGFCLIGGLCVPSAAVQAGNPCRVCAPATSPYSWTDATQGMDCEPEDACQANATCQAGECVGTPVECPDPGEACRQGACDSEFGCTTVAVANGSYCDDLDLCTSDDRCQSGVCRGDALVCPQDDNPCTVAACDAQTGSCAVIQLDGDACDDGNPCTLDGICQAAACLSGPPNPCNDGNQCTIDTCVAGVGCYHIPDENPCCIGAVSVCDDSNPCTDDFCDPVTGQCSYSFNSAACSDGLLCTANDQCAEGVCTGTPVVCDDGNVCTSGSCNPSVGCVFSPLSGMECDDGLECSTGDMCVNGVCLGDMTGCQCVPEFQDATKIISAALGTGPEEGEALDVDGNGTLDNAFGGLGGLANGPLADAVASGAVMLLAEFRDRTAMLVTMAVYNGSLHPDHASCDFQTQTCGYVVDPAMVLPDTCLPLVSMPGTLSGNNIQAGGPGTSMPFSIPITDTAVLDITLHMVQFQGTLDIQNGEVVGFEGILAGAITEANLMEAIDALPPDALAGIGMTPAQLKMLLPALVPNDVSTTGGALNAKSIGLKLTAIDGWILGVGN